MPKESSYADGTVGINATKQSRKFTRNGGIAKAYYRASSKERGETIGFTAASKSKLAF